MSMYPSLEDMKVDQMAKAQQQHHASQQPTQPALQAGPGGLPYPVQPRYSTTILSYPGVPPHPQNEKFSTLYPSLDDYMGLDLTQVQHEQQLYPDGKPQPSNQAVAVLAPSAVAIPSTQALGPSGMMVAPLSGNSAGLMRAAVTHGIRELVLCKDSKGKVGMRMHSINKGIFVTLVQANTPAALAGLRFGDQVLIINETVVAGYSMDKVHDIIKKADSKRITLAVRDRPFERTVTLHKDSAGNIGFAFKGGKIGSLIKDSSAARNGLLTEHYLLEVNGQNVVGLKDKQTHEIINQGGQIITITIMPAFIYEHMMKHMSDSLAKKLMDHSIPDL